VRLGADFSIYLMGKVVAALGLANVSTTTITITQANNWQLITSNITLVPGNNFPCAALMIGSCIETAYSHANLIVYGGKYYYVGGVDTNAYTNNGNLCPIGFFCKIIDYTCSSTTQAGTASVQQSPGR
jgi:hypothetical protein